MSILGNKVLRLEDPKLLSVGGEYVADLKREAMLYVSYVTSTVAHAKILEIDVTEAREISGVVAVYTADDVELAPMASMFRDKPAMNRPFLAKDRVRFVGEPVAMVVATSYEVAADAKEAIFIDYEPLPVVVDPEQAFSDEVVIYDEVGSNKVTTFGEITDDSFFDGSDVIVTLKLRNQRLAPAPLEVRAAMAYVDQDGRLVFYASTQTPHAVKAELSRSLSLEDRKSVV